MWKCDTMNHLATLQQTAGLQWRIKESGLIWTTAGWNPCFINNPYDERFEMCHLSHKLNPLMELKLRNQWNIRNTNYDERLIHFTTLLSDRKGRKAQLLYYAYWHWPPLKFARRSLLLVTNVLFKMYASKIDRQTGSTGNTHSRIFNLKCRKCFAAITPRFALLSSRVISCWTWTFSQSVVMQYESQFGMRFLGFSCMDSPAGAFTGNSGELQPERLKCGSESQWAERVTMNAAPVLFLSLLGAVLMSGN